MREFELLEQVYRANADLGADVTIPPGDDLGAIRFSDTELLVGVDQLADGVHFSLATTPIDKIGQKAMNRCLSDVAAMAAIPHSAMVTAALPRDFTRDRAEALFHAMRHAGAGFNCPLIGGDIVTWDHPLLLTVAVTAYCRPNAPVTRRGAKIGDVICVTGQLGGGLHAHDGCTHHLDFTPRIELARQLANLPGAPLHSMIDLSDGLARDLGQICLSSKVSAILQADQLPVSAAARAMTQQDQQPLWRHAVADGEDYELCFTLSEQNARTLPQEMDGAPISQIGRMVAQDKQARVRIELSDGSTPSVDALGWEHEGANHGV